MFSFKRVLIVVLLTLLMIVFVSFFLPSTIKIERDITVNASQKNLFNQVNELKNWKNWSAWVEIDSSIYDAPSSYSPISSGAGAVFEWNSKQEDLGKGKIKITTSNPNELIELNLMFGESEATSYWYFQPKNNEVLVTWGINVNLGFNPFSKWVGLFLESEIAPDIEKGLKKLKKYAEEYPIINSGLASKKTLENDQWYISFRDTLHPKKHLNIHAQLLAVVEDYLLKDSIRTDLPAIVIYHFWSDTLVDIEAGIFVKDSVAVFDNSVKLNKIYKGNVVTASHFGNYDRLPETYFSINEWMRKNSVEITGPPWEVYKVDATTEQNPMNWITEIYFPIK